MSVTWDLLPWTMFVVLVAGIVIGGFAVWVLTRPEEPDPIPTGRFDLPAWQRDLIGQMIEHDGDVILNMPPQFAGGTGNGRESRPGARPYNWQTDG